MSEHVKYVSKSVNLLHPNRSIPSILVLKGGRAHLAEWNVPMRSLPDWHIYWNSTAGVRMILPDREIEMDPGSVWLLPSHLVFATASTAPFDHFFLDFRLEDERFLRMRKEPVRFRTADYRWILKRCLERDFTGLTGGTLILALLSAIPAEYFVPEGEVLMDPRIQYALDLISSAFQSGQIRSLTNGMICRKIGMSLVNFQHPFKRQLKIPPHRYILNRRLAYAYELLKTSRLSIEEITERTGFINRYQFTKSFTEVYGISPARSRK